MLPKPSLLSSTFDNKVTALLHMYRKVYSARCPVSAAERCRFESCNFDAVFLVDKTMMTIFTKSYRLFSPHLPINQSQYTPPFYVSHMYCTCSNNQLLSGRSRTSSQSPFLLTRKARSVPVGDTQYYHHLPLMDGHQTPSRTGKEGHHVVSRTCSPYLPLNRRMESWDGNRNRTWEWPVGLGFVHEPLPYT